MNILLASASPRRQELLALTGLSFQVVVAEVDEASRTEGEPRDLAEANALLKAEAVFDQHPDATVIGADTIVVLAGSRILGKPGSAEEAQQMLEALSGCDHEVFTGVAIVPPGSQKQVFSVRTRVTFRVLNDEEITEYIATGEPMDKAGAYGIQGQAAHFVREIAGSYTNVVGLPVAEVLDHINKVENE